MPAAWRAPKSGPAIYTASAPQSIAAMPISKFLAGARSSRKSILLEGVDELLGLSTEGRVIHCHLEVLYCLGIILCLLIESADGKCDLGSILCLRRKFEVLLEIADGVSILAELLGSLSGNLVSLSVLAVLVYVDSCCNCTGEVLCLEGGCGFLEADVGELLEG